MKIRFETKANMSELNIHAKVAQATNLLRTGKGFGHEINQRVIFLRAKTKVINS